MKYYDVLLFHMLLFEKQAWKLSESAANLMQNELQSR